MATRQNLIDTYNANPTLQARYTLPQYLSLFDFSQTTTTPVTTPTTPTPTPTTPGIPNIINQNLNQGGDGDGGPPPGPSYSRDDDLGTSDYQGTGPGFFESIMGIPAAIANVYTQFSPIGFISRKIEANKIAKEKALQAEIDAANKAAAEQARLDAAYQQQTITQQQAGGGPGGQFDGASSKQEYDKNPTGFSGSFQDGGRVYLYNRLK